MPIYCLLNLTAQRYKLFTDYLKPLLDAYDRIDDKNVLLLAVEIDVAKVVFNEYNLKDVVVAIAQKYMVVA